MKNSYLFANEMDQLAVSCQTEIGLLNKTNDQHEVIEYLKTIKKSLSLLALNICLSISNDQEKNLIEELFNTVNKIITSHTNNHFMLSKVDITYLQFSQLILQLIQHYEMEKIAPIHSTRNDAIINKFNEATRVFSYNLPLKKIKTAFLNNEKTVIFNFNE